MRKTSLSPCEGLSRGRRWAGCSPGPGLAHRPWGAVAAGPPLLGLSAATIQDKMAHRRVKALLHSGGGLSSHLPSCLEGLWLLRSCLKPQPSFLLSSVGSQEPAETAQRNGTYRQWGFRSFTTLLTFYPQIVNKSLSPSCFRMKACTAGHLTRMQKWPHKGGSPVLNRVGSEGLGEARGRGQLKEN